MNSRSGMDIIYLDYAKAFDSVVHNKLMAKLACYGINDMLLTWISNFLIGRVQYVRMLMLVQCLNQSLAVFPKVVFSALYCS